MLDIMGKGIDSFPVGLQGFILFFACLYPLADDCLFLNGSVFV